MVAGFRPRGPPRNVHLCFWERVAYPGLPNANKVLARVQPNSGPEVYIGPQVVTGQLGGLCWARSEINATRERGGQAGAGVASESAGINGSTRQWRLWDMNGQAHE